MLNLDTHILVHALSGELTSRERSLLAREQWSISAIVLWKLVKLVQLGRIELDLDDPQFQTVLSGTHIWPITLAVCRATGDLDFKADPADELIAATSLVHDIPLVTRDRRIRRSRIVPLT